VSGATNFFFYFAAVGKYGGVREILISYKSCAACKQA